MRDVQLEAAQPEGTQTKAALKTPQSKRWRAGQDPQDGDTLGTRNGFRRPCAALGIRLRCASARQAGVVAAQPLPPTYARAVNYH